MPVRLLEVARVDRAIGPILGIRGGGDPLLAPSQLLAGLGLGLFPPLVHLDQPPEPDHPRRDVELGVLERLVRGGLAADVDQLPLVRRVDPIRGDRDDRRLAFGQGLGGPDGAALVPEEHDEGSEEQDQAEWDAKEGVPQARGPTLRADLRVAVAAHLDDSFDRRRRGPPAGTSGLVRPGARPARSGGARRDRPASPGGRGRLPRRPLALI